MKRAGARWGPSLLAALVALSFADAAAAHPVGLSTGDYRASGDGLSVELTVGRQEAVAALPLLDGNEDGVIAARELVTARASLAKVFVDGIRVTRADEPCAGVLTTTTLTENDGLSIRGEYRCARIDSPTKVELDFLRDLSFGHRHAAHVVAGEVVSDELCTRARPSFEVGSVDQARSEPAVGSGLVAASGPALAGALGFLRMGFEHILAGFDHILFLFALVLVGRKLRPMALMVTAFTVAHSLTLASSAFGILSPPAWLVEPAIALSIAYVGMENLFLQRIEGRWRITFVFGLLHGFGFASALSDAAIPRPQIPVALVMFNVGVEIGQLAILAALLPLVVWMGRSQRVARRLVPGISLAIVVAGLAFFVDRAWLAIHPAAPVVWALGTR